MTNKLSLNYVPAFLSAAKRTYKHIKGRGKGNMKWSRAESSLALIVVLGDVRNKKTCFIVADILQTFT